MKVPGEIEKKEHLYMAENQQNGISTKMEIDAIIDSKNKYLIMSGKDKIFIKEYSNITRNYTKYRPTKFDMVDSVSTFPLGVRHLQATGGVFLST